MATALHGDLPPILQRVNNKFVPTALLYLQGIVGSILALVYLLLPNVNAGYWYLTVITSQIYCVLYIMLFIAAIRLRYTQPNVQRPYKIPGGKLGMWFVSVVGLVATIFAFIIGFAPPTQISFGQIFESSTLAYVIPVASAMIVCCLVPLWAFKFRRPEWVSEARKLGLEED
jgi:amino acid transporter